MFALGINKQVLRLAPFEHMLEEERAATLGGWIKPLVEGAVPEGKPTSPVFVVRKNDVLRTWATEPYSDDEKRELRASRYPAIGDQLDAIMKGFEAMEKAGVPLPAETIEWVKLCRQVKSK